jgi:hypothetical protein
MLLLMEVTQLLLWLIKDFQEAQAELTQELLHLAAVAAEQEVLE